MLTFVGIGPGDPELVTLKAARVIREADAVAIPDTGTGRSLVREILGDLLDGKPVLRLPMPMRGKREDWKTAHEAAAERILEWLKTYPNIAYPVLGDPGIYATSSYLMRLIEEKHPCAVIPGIPTMCAAAARLGIPLCEQGETLTVNDDGTLPEGTVVSMKASRKLDALRAAVNGRKAYLVQELGLPNELVTELKEDTEIPVSYFTTVIVK